MSEKKPELRGKSWKREREERGRRQLAQKDRSISSESNENDVRIDDSFNEKRLSDQSTHVNTTPIRAESDKQGGNPTVFCYC